MSQPLTFEHSLTEIMHRT